MITLAYIFNSCIILKLMNLIDISLSNVNKSHAIAEYRDLQTAGQPSFCMNALIYSSTLLEWERITELCAISACQHLCCVIKTILTKYDTSAIFRKKKFKFSTVFLTRINGRISEKSEFKMNFLIKIRVAIESVFTRNFYFRKYFYKIQLNFTYCDFIQCLNTVLHGSDYKYNFYEFQTFLFVTILFKPC